MLKLLKFYLIVCTLVFPSNYCIPRAYVKYHLQVKCVHYPGLKSHPEHHIATQQMTGFGGVVSFEVCLFVTVIHILFAEVPSCGILNIHCS